MEKNNQQLMELNRETAMRLWNKSFGKEAKATDFAGRTIAKGAYNDRNSDFGWNVDHIQPQSKGGVTADHNLVCCHILTNDEKADKFPCFKANGHPFEIVKVQNHYEIRSRNGTPKAEKPECIGVDFYDSAAGLRFFKKFKGIQNKGRFVGAVWIRLDGVSNYAVIDFIEALFEEENLSFDKGGAWENQIRITVLNYDMPLKVDTQQLLDKCVLLNTYLSAYFVQCGYIQKYDIFYRVDCFDQKDAMYGARYFTSDRVQISENTIFVNGLVWDNTDAKEKIEKNRWGEYTKYNYIFTNLAENLTKEANRG